MRMYWGKLLRRSSPYIRLGSFRGAVPIEIVPHRRFREDRSADDREEFLVQRMVAQVDGALAELLPCESAQVLQPFENHKVAIEALGELDEGNHLAKVVELVGEGELQLWNVATLSQPRQKLHVLEKRLP